MVQERENVEDIIGHFVIHLWDDSIIWFKCDLILQSDGTLNGSKIYFFNEFYHSWCYLFILSDCNP